MLIHYLQEKLSWNRRPVNLLTCDRSATVISMSARYERILEEVTYTLEDNFDREILLSRLVLFGSPVRSLSFIFLSLPPLMIIYPALYKVIFGLTNPFWPTFWWNPDLHHDHLIFLTQRISKSAKRDVEVSDPEGWNITESCAKK